MPDGDHRPREQPRGVDARRQHGGERRARQRPHGYGRGNEPVQPDWRVQVGLEEEDAKGVQGAGTADHHEDRDE